MLDTVIDNDTELFDESIFDISCEVEPYTLAGEVCDSPADVFVRWKTCPGCGRKDSEFMCSPCYTSYIYTSDKEGNGVCIFCDTPIWMESVTSIR